MNKDDLEYLRGMLGTDHQTRSAEPAAAEEMKAALADFTLQSEVETLAAQEAASQG